MADAKFYINFSIFNEDGEEIGRVDTRDEPIPLEQLPQNLMGLVATTYHNCEEYSHEKEVNDLQEENKRLREMADFEQSVKADLETL
jgi:hypothetical protein